MTIKLKLEPDLQSRVEAQAAASGLPIEAWLHEVIEQAAPQLPSPVSTSALFASWDVEDATSDCAELDRRRREFAEFQSNMNRNRAGEWPLYK